MYIYTYMATKTISILEEAYKALLREKGKKESFSRVILRLTSRRSRISDSLGKWKMSEKEAKEIERELADAWKNFGRGHKWNA